MHDNSGHRRNLYLVALSTTILYAAMGCTFTWTSPVLPRLMKSDSWLVITEEQGSWIASLLSIGGIFGPLLAGKLLDIIGRKWTIILDTLLLVLSWIVLLMARNVWMIYIGRIMAGVATAIVLMSLPMYIAEISDDSVRCILSSTMEFSVSLGFNLQYVIGPYLSYHSLTLVSALIPMVFLITFFFMPESPYYLITKNRKEEAVKNIQWLRGNISKSCSEKEMVIIESTMYELLQKKSSVWDLVKVPGNRKALVVACGLQVAQQLSGITILSFYDELIFIKSGTNIKPAYCAMAVGTCQVIASIFAVPIAKRYGYKIPLLISCSLMALEHFAMGLFFYMLSYGYDVSQIQWLPVTCMVAYIITYSSAYGPGPWAVMGEIFPTNVKAVASSLVTTCNMILTFITTKFFVNISDTFGMYTAFWIMSVSMVLSFFFKLYFMPDTKGLSFQEIQDLLNNKRPSTISKNAKPI